MGKTKAGAFFQGDWDCGDIPQRLQLRGKNLKS
jgi:hypothetical protein